MQYDDNRYNIIHSSSNNKYIDHPQDILTTIVFVRP